MKINIPIQQSIISETTPSPCHQQQQHQRYTQGTENMFNQFIDSIPSPQLQLQLDLDTDAQAPNFELLDQHFGCSDVNFEKLILGCTPTPKIEETMETNLLFKTPIQGNDHEYSSNKRTFSESFFEDSLDSSAASSVFGDSLSSDLLAKRGLKNQRTRGIYRADDVTNPEELNNYLERRKKNNISSKISRANKKRNYNDMDYKCDELERSNCSLAKKIIDLEKLNKVIKDMLVEKFTQSKPWCD